VAISRSGSGGSFVQFRCPSPDCHARAAHVSFLDFIAVPDSPLNHRHSETAPHLTVASSNSEASQTCQASGQAQVTMAESWLVSPADAQSISTNEANRPTQRPRVHTVWCCHWLSKRRAKTKRITSQAWARLDVSGGGPLLWYASIPTDALQRIFMTARSSRNCLQATGHAFHWLSWCEQGTRGWPNDSGRLQTGLFGVALPFKLQKKDDPARPPRDVLRD